MYFWYLDVPRRLCVENQYVYEGIGIVKVYLDMVGCRLNQAEIEQYSRQFRAAGHTLVASPEEADLVVVNTCAVTNAAASDSRQKIRQAQRAGVEQIVVTGCWSTLKPEQAAALPGVQRVIPNAQKDSLVSDLLQIDLPLFELEPVEREAVPGTRLRTRAFIKVQDGCNNRCTFCVTTIARGAGRSLPVEQVLDEINAAVAGGAQEAVLTGVHLGSWGQDFETPAHLRQLVQAILVETDIPRLRLSSVEPWDLEPEFFALWEDPRLCRHLHLPLQSGSAGVLRHMARKTTPQSFTALLEEARRMIPGVAITTDLIAGFPGETEQDFIQGLDFVRAMDFAGGHVFTYSARGGTTAAHMPGQVPFNLRRERNARLRDALAESAERYRSRFLGETLEVLWETAHALGPDGWELSGLTDNYLRVEATAPEPLWNRITPVRLERSREEKVWGSLVIG